MELYGQTSSSLEIALTAILAAVYAIGTVALAPISFLAFQVRVTDAIIPLAFYLKRPAVVGVTIGCIVANLFSPLGFIDILFGTVANFLAAASCMYAPKWYLAWITPVSIIPLLVGFELALLFGMDMLLFFIFDVFVGSVVAIGILGTTVLKVVMETFTQFDSAFPYWR